jgi:integrase
MARSINKLSEVTVRNAKKPGLYGDGLNLYLHVGPTGGKSWVFRFMLGGKAYEMGLGPVHTIGLKMARATATEYRRLCLAGINPLAARDADRALRRRETAKAVTFRTCAEQYIVKHQAGWKNDRHTAQWTSTLEAYAYPVIGDLSVADIATGHITKILEPIWTAKTETASRVRGRIESILDFATTHGWRKGENPARWKGHLANVLPKKGKVKAKKHHPALPWQEMSQFMAALAAQKSVAALALRFTILTAGRSNEILGARWGEIDEKAAVWIVPAERMKAKKEHRVPLCEPALAVLREAFKLRDGDVIFPGGKKNAPLVGTAMRKQLTRMKRDDLTVHGFRSSFRDWAAETGKPADIAEAALAHLRGDETVRAYQRGDLLERRRHLMADWAAFCAGRSSGVVRQLRQDIA